MLAGQQRSSCYFAPSFAALLRAEFCSPNVPLTRQQQKLIVIKPGLPPAFSNAKVGLLRVFDSLRWMLHIERKPIIVAKLIFFCERN